MEIAFRAPEPRDYIRLFGTPMYSEVLTVDGAAEAMAVLIKKPDGRVFAWTMFRGDLTPDVGRRVVLSMRRALRAYRRCHPDEPVYSGADERGYPQVPKMLKALRFVPTDEFQPENKNRVWVWLPGST
jgi:hypothetical protein